MKGYLILLGVVIVTLSIIGGALYLSSSYDQYQRHLQAVGAPPGAPITLFDMAKWEFAKLVGGGILFGGVILGSLLMGMGWIGKTLEDIRDALSGEVLEASAEPIGGEKS